MKKICDFRKSREAFMVLAAPHFLIRKNEFYVDWAFSLLDSGVSSKEVVNLAISDVDSSPEEMKVLIAKVILCLELNIICREGAAGLVFIDYFSNLPNDVLSCWSIAQDIRLLDELPLYYQGLYLEIEAFDLDMGMAGEDGAVFPSCFDGVQAFKQASANFVRNSTVQWVGLPTGRTDILVKTPAFLGIGGYIVKER